jgi:hypothetical protein
VAQAGSSAWPRPGAQRGPGRELGVILAGSSAWPRPGARRGPGRELGVILAGSSAARPASLLAFVLQQPGVGTMG